jgi:hypothetical protein
VTSCEACHGPGKAHLEEGEPAKIISFKNKSSKEISETCLTCHAGKEERNNFRRGEYWRNDIGCTDCHTSHSSPTNRNISKSIDSYPVMLSAGMHQSVGLTRGVGLI